MRTRDYLAVFAGFALMLLADTVDQWARRPERIWARLHRKLRR